jgi:hypothetical protein
VKYDSTFAKSIWQQTYKLFLWNFRSPELNIFLDQGRNQQAQRETKIIQTYKKWL